MADSLDFKRQQTDLRKTVGIQEGNKGRLGAASARSNWGGVRSIGFMAASSLEAGTATGTSGSTTLGSTFQWRGGTLGSVKNGTTEKPASETGGNEVDPRDPSKSIRPGGGGSGGDLGNGDGKFDVEKVIDEPTTMKEVEQFETGIGQITEAANGGGTLNALTGLYDCDNPSIELEIRTDGFFEPPAGWENADTPPPNEEWIPGENWSRFDGGVSCIILNASIGVSAATALAWTIAQAEGGGDTITVLSEGFGSAPGCPIITNPVYVVNIQSALFPSITHWYFIRQSCTQGVTANCPIANPVRWPEDGKLQLRLQNGLIAPSDYEPEADRVAKFYNGQGRSQIDFCFGDGRTGSFVPTSNMGYMVFETSGGNPTGIIKVFNSANKVIGYTDPSGMLAYLPT